MKIVILTTATGQGHNSAAAALATCLTAKNCDVKITDVLKSGDRNASSAVSSLYSSLVNHAPWIFGLLYHAGEKVSSSTRHNPIYYLNTLYSKSFRKLLDELCPDVIVCTHIFSGQALTHLKEKGLVHTPSVGIMTDYTCSPFWEETRLDRYVIPSGLLENEFAGKGIPREKLFAAGIPVNARFREKTPKDRARAELGLDAEKIVTVMGGSMGFGDIAGIVGCLKKKMPRVFVVAVCGNNRKLQESLSGFPGVLALPFMDRIPLLMDASDVLITKPGGLSATEAAVKRIPVVFSRPIPGGEEHNAAFFSTLGMAAVGRLPEQAANAACELIGDSRLCQRMINAQEKYIDGDADKHISDLIIGLAKSPER